LFTLRYLKTGAGVTICFVAVTPPVVLYAKLTCERFTVFKHEASQAMNTNWKTFQTRSLGKKRKLSESWWALNLKIRVEGYLRDYRYYLFHVNIYFHC
jgi:hypothetical protein